jgi:hypothetical protein
VNPPFDDAGAGTNKMTDDEIRVLVALAGWTFAKTMPQCPHEYVVRGKTLPEDEFLRFAAHIRKHGDVRRWSRYRHTYFDLDGYHYWTMGAPLEQTAIINRQRNEDFAKGLA